ncbi:MAG: RluA family pseudouridine synthase [Clostridia bacterium]|nr:RluA family pseudouridine synthase [Clostridia bacterium]
MKTFTFKVEKQFNNYTILNFLKEIGVSNEIIKKVKFNGLFLNETKIKNINDLVKEGDVIKVVFNDVLNPFIKAQNGNLQVVYEDEYLLVVNKESGVLTHSSRHNESLSLEGLVYNYNKSEPYAFRAVNRLDKDTRGLVLIAKDELTASLLNEQIKQGKIEKRYIAKVKNEPKQNHFIIEKSIKRQSENSVKRVVDGGGQYAKTECFYLGKDENGLHNLEVLLHTGRTHQIRVHLQSENLALYADALYGEKVAEKTYYLNAYKLTFTHPFLNKKLTLTTLK